MRVVKQEESHKIVEHDALRGEKDMDSQGSSAERVHLSDEQDQVHLDSQ